MRENASSAGWSGLFDPGRVEIWSDGSEATTGAVFTLVLWLGCVAVGVLGLTLEYERPRSFAQAPPVVRVEMVDVELDGAGPSLLDALASDEAPTSAFALPRAPALPSPAPAPAVIPEATPLKVVAMPAQPIAAPALEGIAAEGSPAVEKTVGPIAEGRAEPGGSVTPAVAVSASSSVQGLTFGEGKGRQPAPAYPGAAVRRSQEGTVRIGFNVCPHGRVVFAKVVAPSPWPLLNQAALRAVRQQWQFDPGPPRRYEVSIDFRLESSNSRTW